MAENYEGALLKYNHMIRWNTSYITDMGKLFIHNDYVCPRQEDYIKYKKLLSIEQLSDWNTSNVTNMCIIFPGCVNLYQNISKWDISKVPIIKDKSPPSWMNIIPNILNHQIKIINGETHIKYYGGYNSYSSHVYNYDIFCKR